MKKIAFIIQQYGLEINGGSELHCRKIAEKLSDYYQIEALTTCSADGSDWANYFSPGTELINKITVHRFEVLQPRDEKLMLELERKIRGQNYDRTLKGMQWIKYFLQKIISKKHKPSEEDCSNWIIAQGPYCPGLISYLKENESRFDCLIFFTYLYYPAVFGMDINPAKTLFIPTAHDEWPLRMPEYKKIFSAPASILYNTQAEKNLVNKITGNRNVFSDIAAVGVDIPADLPYIDIKKEKNISADYILYAGRVEANKIPYLYLEWFLKYIKETGRKIKLLLIGQLFMEIPQSDDIISLGFVSDDIKFNAIRQSLFLFQPSKYESLSMVLLEAFMMEKPVIVQAENKVMKDHIEQSNGGLCFTDYRSFKKVFDSLIDNSRLREQLGRSGKAYVQKNYQWENIIDKYRNVIENRIPERLL